MCSFIFYSFFFLGLPADFNSDLVVTYYPALERSFSELWGMILDPTSPGWFYAPRTVDALKPMEFLRPLCHLIVKFNFVTFGNIQLAGQILAIIALTIINVFLFAGTFFFTKKRWLAWSAVALFISFPSNLFNMLSIMPLGMQYWATVISIVFFWVFGLLVQSTGRRSVFLFVLLLIVFWTGVKLNSGLKVLPVIAGGFLVLRAIDLIKRMGFIKFLALGGGLLLFLIIFTVPFTTYEKWAARHGEPALNLIEQNDQNMTLNDQKTTTYKFDYFFARTFWSSQEQFKRIFPLNRKKTIPLSLTGNFAFFFSVFFWGSLLVLPFVYRKIYADEEESASGRRDFYFIALAWFLFSIMMFGTGGQSPENPRYLIYAYIPMLYLLFANISLAGKFFSKYVPAKYLKFFLIAIVVYTAASNMRIHAASVKGAVTMQSASVEVEKAFHLDLNGQVPAEQVFYKSHPQIMQDYLLVVDWHEMPDTWFEKAAKNIETFGAFYYLSIDENPSRLQEIDSNAYQVDLTATIKQYGRGTLYSKLIHMTYLIADRFGLKKYDSKNFYLYRISPSRYTAGP